MIYHLSPSVKVIHVDKIVMLLRTVDALIYKVDSEFTPCFFFYISRHMHISPMKTVSWKADLAYFVFSFIWHLSSFLQAGVAIDSDKVCNCILSTIICTISIGTLRAFKRAFNFLEDNILLRLLFWVIFKINLTFSLQMFHFETY